MTKIGFTGTGYAVCLAMASALVGCGGATSGESPDGSSTADGPQSSAPQAIIKNDDGREYLRVDLWDPADLALIMEQAAPHEGPETAESLAANLRRLVAGEALQPYRPQGKALVLLSCGGRSAIAARGGWTAQGRLVWRWKDWLDRRWVSALEGER